ncbi:iron dicitrate transport regulator FecR [Chitinophaga parva]|uniref:Iron dicitrate transport regulator FecR n=1 Tax=Chitinophaga parva TaxID=2169414 RepID=A0A2T7BHW8_9BACT|nr:FecR family protein [Chitinophaga parva]PUZ25843.1 iron dicitrate transport regulator FecR [Chitinophaga parva]
MAPSNFPKDLFQKLLDGTLTDPESVTLFAWFRENPDSTDPALESLLEQAYHRSFAAPPALLPGAGDRILHRLMESTTPVVRMRRRWLQYAAAAALLVAVAGTATILVMRQRPATPLAGNVIKPGKHGNYATLTLGNGTQIQLDSAHGNIVRSGDLLVDNHKGELDYQGQAGSAELHTLTTPKGGQYKLLLPDGTIVWLNAGSSITYPTAFNETSRQVKMTGEAYFEIKQAAARPFVVNVAGKASVEVLGTAFNVNAYADEPGIRTTLLQGSVRMHVQDASAVLHPGQQAVIKDAQLQVTSADTATTVAWKDGLFRFDHTSLDEVLRQVARWYDLEVVYETGIPHLPLSGEIKRDLDLEQALSVLRNLGLHYRLEGRQLIVTP